MVLMAAPAEQKKRVEVYGHSDRKVRYAFLSLQNYNILFFYTKYSLPNILFCTGEVRRMETVGFVGRCFFANFAGGSKSWKLFYIFGRKDAADDTKP